MFRKSLMKCFNQSSSYGSSPGHGRPTWETPSIPPSHLTWKPFIITFCVWTRTQSNISLIHRKYSPLIHLSSISFVRWSEWKALSKPRYPSVSALPGLEQWNNKVFVTMFPYQVFLFPFFQWRLMSVSCWICNTKANGSIASVGSDRLGFTLCPQS